MKPYHNAAGRVHCSNRNQILEHLEADIHLRTCIGLERRHEYYYLRDAAGSDRQLRQVFFTQQSEVLFPENLTGQDRIVD